MSEDRSTLTMPDLDDFAPRPKKPAGAQSAKAVKKAVDKSATFPSREPPRDVQINIAGPAEIIERFKTMAKDDRRSYYAMLEILMDSFEEKGRTG
ncbi:MAG: hypothetical protein AAF636_08530 [Pseudomonadota bacterium]